MGMPLVGLPHNSSVGVEALEGGAERALRKNTKALSWYTTIVVYFLRF